MANRRRRSPRRTQAPTHYGRRGRIFHEAWVDCGYCADAQPVVPPSGDPDHAREARRMGFHLTADVGWVCPRCWQERIDAKREGRPHTFART